MTSGPDHPVARRAGRSGRSGRPAAGRGRPAFVAPALLAAAALAGCFDGYPSEDLASPPPSQMSQAQRLAALNQLGRQPHLAQRWRYALRASCQLEVRAGQGEAHTTEVVALGGSSLHSRYDDGSAQHELHLQPPRPAGARHAVAHGLPVEPTPEPTLVLQSTKWTDSVQARTLLAHLASGCDGEASTTG